MEPAGTDDEALLDLIRLTMVAGVGPHILKALLERFKSPGRVLAASRAALRDVPGIGPKLADSIIDAPKPAEAQAELDLCRQHGVRLLAQEDCEYPRLLKDIPDPPKMLYVKGRLEPRDELAIAIVGSRRSTPYGERTAERLASALARTGFTVVSGLARGVDTAAHRVRSRPAVAASPYSQTAWPRSIPPSTFNLARALTESGGLVSEMPMRQSPLAGLFTQRNRIISGLCLGVVVVEATPRSGSLSTAGHAVEQNREVFAVPGPVRQPLEPRLPSSHSRRCAAGRNRR